MLKVVVRPRVITMLLSMRQQPHIMGLLRPGYKVSANVRELRGLLYTISR